MTARFDSALAALAFLVLTLVGALATSSCASAPPAPPGHPALASEELAILGAVAANEAALLDPPGPVVVLDVTNPWSPPRESGERWDRMRAVNATAHSIAALPSDTRVSLYSGVDYRHDKHCPVHQNRLSDRLGGLKPLVLELSRPAIDPTTGETLVLVHVLSSSKAGDIETWVDARASNGAKLRICAVHYYW